MTQLWNQNLPSKIVTSLFLLGMITPSPANAGGLASDYRAENEGTSLQSMCKEVQTMFVTTGEVPLYAYTQKTEENYGPNHRNNGVEIEYKMIKNGKVYGRKTWGLYIKLYDNGSAPYLSDCEYIHEIATLGQETVKYDANFGTVRNLWTMEGNKLIHYQQEGKNTVDRFVWN